MPPIYIGERTVIARYIGSRPVQAVMYRGEDLLGGAVEPPTGVLRIASLDNKVATGSEGLAGMTHYVLRFPFVLAKNQPSVVLNFANMSVSGTSAVGLGNAFTVMSATVDDGITAAQAMFGGGASATLADGVVDVNTDAVSASSLGLPTFSAGVTYLAKAHLSVPVAANKLPITWAYTGATFTWFDPATTTLGNENGVGAYTLTGGSPVGRSLGYMPIVLGVSATDSHNAAGVGDSIIHGQGDTSVSTAVLGGGFAHRACRSGAEKIAFLNLGRQTIKTAFIAGANCARLREYYKYARTIIAQPGTNDFGATGTTVAPSTLETNTELMWSQMRAAGVVNILHCELLPRISASADGCTTEAGMTVDAGWQTGAYPDQFNQWLHTKELNGKIEAAVSMPSNRGVDPAKWSVVGGAHTTDFTHPIVLGHSAAADDLMPALYAHL